MSTLAATPAQIAAAIARSFLRTHRDPCYHGPEFPVVEDHKVLWAVARHGGDPKYWKMAMIQLIATAEREGNSRLFGDIFDYLTDEASPAQLQDDVLWRFIQGAPPWMASKVKGLRFRLREIALAA